jgi:hypothetical protein
MPLRIGRSSARECRQADQRVHLIVGQGMCNLRQRVR